MDDRQIKQLLTLLYISGYISLVVADILGTYYTVRVPNRCPLAIGYLIFWGLLEVNNENN